MSPKLWRFLSLLAGGALLMASVARPKDWMTNAELRHIIGYEDPAGADETP